MVEKDDSSLPWTSYQTRGGEDRGETQEDQ